VAQRPENPWARGAPLRAVPLGRQQHGGEHFRRQIRGNLAILSRTQQISKGSRQMPAIEHAEGISVTAGDPSQQLMIRPTIASGIWGIATTYPRSPGR
jgi:hypothetical protein